MGTVVPINYNIFMKDRRAMDKTIEEYNQRCLELVERDGLQTMGIMSNYIWYSDPKRMVFILSRYKFVAKMFSGMERVLEIGCADGFGSRIVSQEVGSLTAIDVDPVFINDAKKRNKEPYDFEYATHDILEAPMPKTFEGGFSLDVLEHIPQEKENLFLTNITHSLIPEGALIIGTPSIQSQAYASQVSKEGHINCKDHAQLKRLMLNYFHNVFMFSMNDEVVHTGFYPMAHYLIALCCNKK